LSPPIPGNNPVTIVRQLGEYQVKILAVLSFAQILGAATAPSLTPTPAPEILVCLERIAQASTSTTYIAQSEASKLLARAAVHVEWVHGRACQSSAAIQVHLTVQTPDTLLPGALAFCQPTARDDIRVLYDRVQAMVSPAREPHLLAYVLAHEIVHILEGTGRHSATGIMKAQWTPEDYSDIASGHLNFASEDIELVHGGVIVRQAQLNALAHKSFTATIH
jgi:hypothetical protein